MKWATALLLALSTAVFGFNLQEKSFDQNVKEASVVVIGLVEFAVPHEKNKFDQELADITVETVLKGKAAASIRVQTYGEIAEESVVLQSGRRYLFLLRTGDGYYRSVNGRYGVIPVDGKPRTSMSAPAKQQAPAPQLPVR